jgi:hypothetical protein
MTADDSPYGDVEIPSSAGWIETRSGATKETILAILEELVLPEKVAVKDVLI